MKKYGIMFTIAMLIFSLFIQSNVQAAPENPKDGTYEVNITALHESEDKESGANSFIQDEATLEVKNGKYILTIIVPKDDMASINGIQLEGKEPINQDGEEWVYELKELKDLYDAQIQYEVPSIGLEHDIGFRLEVDYPEIEEDFVGSFYEGLNKVGATYTNAKDGSTSTMGRYLDDSVYVEQNNNQSKLYVHVKDNETVTALQVENKKHVDIITNGKESLYVFDLDELEPSLQAYVEYSAQMGDGKVHNGQADFIIELDENNIEEVDRLPFEQEKEDAEEEADKEKPKDESAKEDAKDESDKDKEEPKEEKPVKPNKPNKQVTTIDYIIKHATENEPSAADSFFEKPGIIVKKDGKTYLEVTITSWSMIENLKAAGKKVKVVDESKKKDQATVHIPIKADLSKEVPLTMKVSVPGLYETEHEARLVMDPDSVKEEKKDEIPKKENPKEEKPKKDTDERKQLSKDQVIKNEPGVKNYQIDYDIKHAKEDTLSVADEFFKKPGILIEKNDSYVLQVTVNNWSMVEWISANGNAVTVVRDDSDKDQALIQIPVFNDLNKAVPLQMKINVPGLYNTVHEARLVMYPNTMEEITPTFDVDESGEKVGGEKLATKNESGAKETSTEEEDIDKPAFGEKTNNKTTAAEDKEENENPKTGDSTKIILYTLLTLGSFTVLIYRLRKFRYSH